GGGLGRLRETCGVVSAAALVLGIVKGYDDPADHEAKKQHYALVRDFAERFRSENASINCRELLTLAGLVPESGGEPEQRTEEFYRKRPCPRLVYDAARILDEMLGSTMKQE
ncbi:MAG: C_GCAxxG_C_C family protein, partial [Clostridia bacterium]|nr:C_GCAxxG_C_C family protein [Clostridia bacterium]